MTWVHYTNAVRSRSGDVVANVETIFDYHSSDTARKAALLELKEYTLGDGDSFTLNPSDKSSITLDEGSDFGIESTQAQTAESMAAAVSGLTDFRAKARTGTEDNSYVSIYYSAANLTNCSSSNTDAWEFWENTATNGTIMAVASDNTGSIQHQPIYTDSDGFLECYIDAPTTIDIVAQKGSKNIDNSRTEELYIPG